MPEAITRVELRDTPRPVRREVESIVQRQAGELVWSVRVYAPADVRAVFDRAIGDHSFADLQTLFREFVDQQERDQSYDSAFAAAFRQQGTAAIAEAQRRAEETSAAVEPAA